jgi:hypothetical protein
MGDSPQHTVTGYMVAQRIIGIMSILETLQDESRRETCLTSERHTLRRNAAHVRMMRQKLLPRSLDKSTVPVDQHYFGSTETELASFGCRWSRHKICWVHGIAGFSSPIKCLVLNPSNELEWLIRTRSNQFTKQVLLCQNEGPVRHLIIASLTHQPERDWSETGTSTNLELVLHVCYSIGSDFKLRSQQPRATFLVWSIALTFMKAWPDRYLDLMNADWTGPFPPAPITPFCHRKVSKFAFSR